jgi:hypothetical protein
MESQPDAAAARLDKAKKRAFNEHIRCAKAHESAARPREALEEYTKALLVFGGAHATLSKKVVSLQKRIEVASTPDKPASFWFSTPVATVDPETVDIPDSVAATDGVAASAASCHVLPRALVTQLAASPGVEMPPSHPVPAHALRDATPPECLPLVPSRTAHRSSTPLIAVHALAQAASSPMPSAPPTAGHAHAQAAARSVRHCARTSASLPPLGDNPDVLCRIFSKERALGTAGIVPG